LIYDFTLDLSLDPSAHSLNFSPMTCSIPSPNRPESTSSSNANLKASSSSKLSVDAMEFNPMNPVHSMSSINAMAGALSGLSGLNPLNRSGNASGTGSVSMADVPTHWSNHALPLAQNAASSESPMMSNHSSPDQDGSVDHILGAVLSKMEMVYSKVVQLEQRVLDLEMLRFKEQSVSEDEKEGQIVDVVKRMDFLEKKVLERKVDWRVQQEDTESADRKRLREWMADKVGLPQYFELFIEHGIEDMDTVRLLELDVISRIPGLDKVGHQMRINHQVHKLKTMRRGAEGGDAE